MFIAIEPTEKKEYIILYTYKRKTRKNKLVKNVNNISAVDFRM